MVVLDNHGFGCSHGLAERCGAHDQFKQSRFREVSSGLLTGEPLPIDFAASASSLGANVICARDRGEPEPALDEAKAARRTPSSLGAPRSSSWRWPCAV